MLKKISIAVAVCAVFAVTLIVWIQSMVPDSDARAALKQTRVSDLPYLQNAISEERGKILAVVTSTDVMGSSGKSTGFELTELARAYYVFRANGFEVDIASPRGGLPPMVIDGDDMGAYDYAFLNDAEAQARLASSIPLKNVNSSEYEALYFVGGKGAMFDFPNNEDIQTLTAQVYQAGGIIAAVCHGPAALVGVTLDNGKSLVTDKHITSFTNDEELFLIPEAREVFPFLLEDELVESGAVFRAGPRYLEQVSNDDRLITGQNPWSVWSLADTTIRELGYEPVAREITAEENSVSVLRAYEVEGFTAAHTLLRQFQVEPGQSVDRLLIAMHGIVAIMDWQLIKLVQLLRLLLISGDENLAVLNSGSSTPRYFVA